MKLWLKSTVAYSELNTFLRFSRNNNILGHLETFDARVGEGAGGGHEGIEIVKRRALARGAVLIDFGLSSDSITSRNADGRFQLLAFTPAAPAGVARAGEPKAASAHLPQRVTWWRLEGVP